MSLSRSVQRQVKSIQKCTQKYISSANGAASKINATRGTLPPAKMRALVSLYHQADTFITPENLSQRIDEAFVLREENNGMLMIGGPSVADWRETALLTLPQLREALEAQREAPRVMEPDREMRMMARESLPYGSTWSDRRTVRERKVMEVLYGVERVKGGEMLPGLEVLLEERERLEKDMKADEEAQVWLEEDMLGEVEERRG
ncbi:hypothetical protein AX17_001123 [Amanita inopinata Kibby_2008]|nr:hypothetical protein AX17_001123 [Amanita inopinata Kibby_2008]